MEICQDCAAAVGLINRLAGTKYRDHGPTVKNLHARHQEYSPKAVEIVIVKKARRWLNDNHMRQFFRPSTLFRPSHFDEYLNEPDPEGGMAFSMSCGRQECGHQLVRHSDAMLGTCSACSCQSFIPR